MPAIEDQRRALLFKTFQGTWILLIGVLVLGFFIEVFGKVEVSAWPSIRIAFGILMLVNGGLLSILPGEAMAWQELIFRKSREKSPLLSRYFLQPSYNTPGWQCYARFVGVFIVIFGLGLIVSAIR